MYSNGDEGGEGWMEYQKSMRYEFYLQGAYDSENQISVIISLHNKDCLGDFPGGTLVKNPPANAGDMGSSPGPGRSYMLWNN